MLLYKCKEEQQPRKGRYKEMTIELKGIGKITANKETLTSLALVFDYARERMETKGYTATASIYEEAFNKTVDSLHNINYI